MDASDFETRFVKYPGFDKIVDKQLRTQLIDFGQTSGPAIAIQKLQSIVGVEPTGILDDSTLEAVSKMHPDDICNHLVVLRVKMIAQVVSKNPGQLKFLSGWLDRALQFLS